MECVDYAQHYAEHYAERNVGSKKVTLHLIRGGYSDHNHGINVCGSRAYFSNKYKCSQLMDEGVKQANALYDKIITRGIHFDRIYTSPLDRTMQTTSVLFCDNLNKYGERIFVTDDLRELNYSHPCNERRNLDELKALYPDFDYSLIRNNDDIIFRYGDTYNRSLSILEEIQTLRMNSKTDLNIALVSHAFFLIEFIRDYLAVDIESIGNCEMISLEIDVSQL
jgi:broad specificity phosphatase PhoE